MCGAAAGAGQPRGRTAALTSTPPAARRSGAYLGALGAENLLAHGEVARGSVSKARHPGSVDLDERSRQGFWRWGVSKTTLQ